MPLITVIVALGSFLISSTSLSQTLQYDQVGVAGGELWLLITGHLSHWSADNLLWDLLVFVVLGFMAERRSRQGFILCLGISAALISTILWFFMTDMDCYRGISGIDSALFGFIALSMVREKIGNKAYTGAGVILVVGAAFALKIVYELFTQQSVFATTAGLYTPVPLAHLAGGLVGIGVALFSSETLRDEQPAHERAQRNHSASLDTQRSRFSKKTD